MFDGAAFGREIVETVKAYCERALAPLVTRLALLEEEVPKQIRGAVFDLVDARNVKEIVAAELMAFPGSEKALEAISTELDHLVEASVKRAVAAMEPPKNGIDGKDGAPGLNGADGQAGRDGVDGQNGRDGVDGKDVEREVLEALVKEHVERVLASWDRPRDGKDGADGRDGIDGKEGPVGPAGLDGRNGLDGKDGVDGRDGIDGKEGPVGIAGSDGRNGIDGKDGADGRHGVGVAGALQDKDGSLVLTMSDGSVVSIGRVQGLPGLDGKDGAPGIDGKDGQNGKDGSDGRDGFGFEDMTEELDQDGRTIIRRYRRGDEVREFRHCFRVVLDRGVWKDGVYQGGDGVSWGGQYFIAQHETSAKPLTAEANGDWRLAVKKGRDGKDGIVRTIPDKPIVKVSS